MTTVPIVDDGHVCDHVVGFYRHEHELVTTVTDFVATALNRGGVAVVVATSEHRRAFESALAAAGLLDAIRLPGRYRSFDARETLTAFMREGRPDPSQFALVVEELFAGVEAGDG